ncbi:MAG: IS30 family transposase [Clostridia bacterium]|nr:IS30 family transposase [Clostridia bacterium]
MKNNAENKNKHLTLQERREIQDCLDHGMTFKAIGKRIGKDQTTVSKEIKKHITVEAKSESANQTELCKSLLKPPFVCNPCPRRRYCRQPRHLYVAGHAHRAYQTLRTESREGLALTREQFYVNDRIISEGVKRGQHLYHIIHTHDLNVSKSTVYRHLNAGYLSVAAIDFPRVVKFKPRKKEALEYVPAAVKKGRTHDCFLDYCAQNDVQAWLEMDTVIGRQGGKVILTFDFTQCNFMFGSLLDNKTAGEVTRAVDELKQNLTNHGFSFGALFPVILTDNGGEFANVAALENSPDGAKEASVFFCDPYQSSQKPHVEKNHTLLRDILPKGSSFDTLTQQMINLIFSHVNSVKRKNLHGKTSYEVFSFIFGNVVAEALGIVPIDAQEVIQSPKLLKMLRNK